MFMELIELLYKSMVALFIFVFNLLLLTYTLFILLQPQDHHIWDGCEVAVSFGGTQLKAR